MPLVTDDVIDCPNKIIGCATASECCYRQYFLLCVNCVLIKREYFRFSKLAKMLDGIG